MSQAPRLLTGYRPERLRRRREAWDAVGETDRSQVGPKLGVDDVRTLSVDVRRAPSGQGSTYRLVFIDLEQASAPAQQALLRLLEEAPGEVRFLIDVSDTSSVLPTIISRCIIETCEVPSLGQAVGDLSRSGLALGSAASMAKMLLVGYDQEDAPDERSFTSAKAFLEASRQGQIELACQLAVDADRKVVFACRDILVGAKFAQARRALVATYATPEPFGAMLCALHAIVDNVR